MRSTSVKTLVRKALLRKALVRKALVRTGLLSKVFICSLLWLSGCQTPLSKSTQSLKIGMEKYEVLEVLGNPHQTRRVRGQDRWSYFFYKETPGRYQTDLFFRERRLVSMNSTPPLSPTELLLNEAKTIEEYEATVVRTRNSKPHQP